MHLGGGRFRFRKDIAGKVGDYIWGEHQASSPPDRAGTDEGEQPQSNGPEETQI